MTACQSSPHTAESPALVDYQTSPDRYEHWSLSFEGPVARAERSTFDETAASRPGYKLKLNCYDLGVDIELHDALQRIRFEHPEVRTVVVTSAKDRIFCSGANIFMLGLSQPRLEGELLQVHQRDAQRHRGLERAFRAEVPRRRATAPAPGGGYELALACDEIILVDDRSSAVSLPEVPLLGVLPGTGGLTRVTDKRHVRHDLADIFCTTTEGVRGQRAKDWRLVDDSRQAGAVRGARCRSVRCELAARSDRPPTPRACC